MQQQLRDVLAGFTTSTSAETIRDVILRYFPDFMTAYGDTAAVLGADFYDQLRRLPPSAGTVASVFAQPAKKDQSEGVVRWAAGFLFGDEPSFESFEAALLGASQRLVMQPARGTIDLLAKSDARSGKVAAVRWSRQLTGRDNCDFCRMLAGRGAAYYSADAAGAVVGRGSEGTGLDGLAASFHDNCDCISVPTFYTRENRTTSVRGYAQTATVLVPVT